MWLPRPMTQRSPIRSTGGQSPRSCPGTIPALRLTCAAIIVPLPIAIQGSPYRAPVGKPITEHAPNDANERPAGASAVILPACSAARQSRCTSRQATALPPRTKASCPAMTDNATAPFAGEAPVSAWARGPGPLPGRHGPYEREHPAAIVRHIVRRQLAAGAVDLAAAGVADRHRYPAGLQR